MEGVKHDTGKDPWHLLPFDAVRAIVKVLAFGAKKYSTTVENEWHALLLVPTVNHALVVTPTGSAVRVTKDSSGAPILSLQNVSERTGGTGNAETQIECANWQSAEKLIWQHVNEIKELSGPRISKNTGSQKLFTKSSARLAARSVGKSETCTLIIATERDAFGASFAPDAITGSDFWTTVWKALSERYAISKPVSRTGARNWENGMAWSRPFAAMQRHLTAWWEGEKADPETGFSHLWHAGCCALFLIAFEMRGVGTDDRPKEKAK